jgi:hypothetical protein
MKISFTIRYLIVYLFLGLIIGCQQTNYDVKADFISKLKADSDLTKYALIRKDLEEKTLTDYFNIGGSNREHVHTNAYRMDHGEAKAVLTEAGQKNVDEFLQIMEQEKKYIGIFHERYAQYRNALGDEDYFSTMAKVRRGLAKPDVKKIITN